MAQVTYAALVLTGGRARRLGGASKADVEIGGEPLIVAALRAATGAEVTVVVGPPTPHHPAALTTREEPAGGGPVAGIAAGLAVLSDPEWVLVLACDAPRAAGAVPTLVAAASGSRADAVVGIDGDQRQPLLALYRAGPLATVLASMEVRSASMRALLERLSIDEVALPPGASRDLDTWEDVEDARRELT